MKIRVEAIRELQQLVNDASISKVSRSLTIREFCNAHKASAPEHARWLHDGSMWTNVDTEHLLEISNDMPLLANYLIERVVAAE